MTERTPGPWKTEAPFSEDGVEYAAQCRILSTISHSHPQGKYLAEVEPVIGRCYDPSPGVGPRNAAFIVAACNAHQELAMILRRIAVGTERCLRLGGPMDWRAALEANLILAQDGLAKVAPEVAPPKEPST